MNPADECLAFSKLVEQGADPEAIARRFGLTIRFVEGRLRLADLAPAVFEALGSGEISLDVAKAYAATPDRERQAWVFEQLHGSYSGNHPDSVRRMMTQATASASDHRALLVGADAYAAAGGRIERDLFSDEAGERWLDVALLERLAAEKMESIAAEKQAGTGLAWVRPTLDCWVPYTLTAGLERFVPEREPLTDEETARIEAAEAEIDALMAVLEDEEAPDEKRRKADEKIRALDREIAELRDKPAIIDDDLKPKLGCFLLLDASGEPRLDSVFYLEPESASERGADDAAGQGASAARDAETSAAGVAGQRPKPLSRTLIDELAIQRRDILAAHVVADPGFALDLATFLMIDQEVVHSFEKTGSSLAAAAPSDPVFGFESAGAAATLARATAADALDRGWTSGSTRCERFDAFRLLPQEERSAWLAHAVARTLEASANGGERRCAFHDHLGQVLEIDVAKWWRPTGANYFDRVPKAVTLAALEEVGGPAFAARYSGLKKAELSQSAERIFAGQIIAEADVKARALAWVPVEMRFAAPEPIMPDADETPPWDEEPGADSGEASCPSAEESGGSDTQVDDSEPSESIGEAA